MQKTDIRQICKCVGKEEKRREKEVDLRVEKTERGIKNAFIELRSKKPLEKITVRELCQKAQINKSTFYTHYKDIYELSDTLEAEVVESITNSISCRKNMLENPAEFTSELMLAYLAQNSLITILFSGNQSGHLASRIEAAVKEMIFEAYPKYRNDEAKNVILSYCILGGYYAFQGNRNVDEHRLIQIIGEITAKIESVWEKD